MGIDLTKIQSASELPGITSLNKDPLVFSRQIGNAGIPIGGSLSWQLPLDFQRTDVMSRIKIKVTGGNIGGLEFPLTGFLGLEDALSLSPFQFAYYMLFGVNASPTGRILNIEAINETVGAVVNMPLLTVTATVDLFDYPF